jgi:signal transduction histidine kinase
MIPGRRWARLAEPRTLVLAVRLGLLGFCLVVAALDAHPRRAIAGGLVLVGAALLSYLPTHNVVVRRLLPTLEACIAAGAVIAPPADRPGLLPYLLAPAFAAGLVYGVIPAITATGMAAFVLLNGHLIAHNPSPLHTFAANSSQWILLAMAVGLLASWIRRLAADAATSDQNSSYEAAYELLSQLRTVSRQLAGGLDPVSLAQGLLQSLHDLVPYGRGAVFIRSAEGGRLVPLAIDGAPFVDWDTSLDDDSPLGKAWAAPRATITREPLAESSLAPDTDVPVGHTALPLRMGSRTFGLVVLEDNAGLVPTRTPISRGATTRAAANRAAVEDQLQLTPAMELVDQTALRLETALLFGEVRSIATSEERRRLAREIHDGIAQELASLGYVVDDLVAEATAPAGAMPTADVLRTLRSEITRIVSELRLSIFDLRSEVQAQVGLGSALSDYVRAVSVGATFTVHLTLDEAPDRLPITVEAELLRIAQEAITNARKHAAAEHLWVICRVEPPFAHLRIEDDGRGMGTKRHDSFGMEVMRERAARLGGALTIGAREPHGTFVDVQLGERRLDSVPDDASGAMTSTDTGVRGAVSLGPAPSKITSRQSAGGRRRHDEKGPRDGRNSAAR